MLSRLTFPLAIFAMVGACNFTGIGGSNGDGDGDGDGDVDATPQPGPDELRAAHVPLSSWGKGAGDLVVRAAAEIDTTNLRTTNLTLPPGALFDAVVQAGALGLDPSEQPREIALLRVGSLHIETTGTLTVTGSRPLVIVVAGDALVEGGIDGRASRSSAGPGGSDSGGLGEGGDGHTAFATERHGGGGGGGFGTDGARGGSVDCFLCIEDGDGGDGGSLYGDPEQTFLYGGATGGRADTCDSDGGGGGGAIQITAETMIQHSGWIAVDGGGGEAGTDCTVGLATIEAGGGGGGSGGAIYLEAPSVVVSGVLSANGGAGASGFPGAPGSDGQMGVSAANGGQSSGSESQSGGDGGVGTTSPENGSGWSEASAGNAGGGGGGVGRITITADSFTTSGSISPPAISL